jgi:uncharacterized protein
LEILLLGGGVKQKYYNPLRINVGFLLHQSVGISRKFEFDEPTVQVAEDLDVYDFQGTIKFTRTAQGLYAHGTFLASTPLECVRCLSDFRQELSIEIDELFIYPPDKNSDPLLNVPETGIVDLTGLLREVLTLDIPIQPLCDPSCQGLCAICGERVSDGVCDHSEIEIDPRMAVLKSLLPDS